MKKTNLVNGIKKDSEKLFTVQVNIHGPDGKLGLNFLAKFKTLAEAYAYRDSVNDLEKVFAENAMQSADGKSILTRGGYYDNKIQ